MIISALVLTLIYLAWNFRKYKGKIYAKILLKSGDSVRVEITDMFGEFTHNEFSYKINRAKIFLDHWIYPRKSLYYLEDKTKPIGFDDDNKPETGGNINPVQLNNILGTKFSSLFKVESEGFLSNVSISKRWIVVIGIVATIGILFLFYGGEIMELIGIGTKKVVERVPEQGGSIE